MTYYLFCLGGGGEVYRYSLIKDAVDDINPAFLTIRNIP